jgi:hypothetical protein
MTSTELDLSALAASAKPTTVQEAATRFADNPFVKLIRESYEAGERGENPWRGNRVTAGQVRTFVAALRNAGTQLSADKIGVHIKYEFKSDKVGKVVEIGDLREVPNEGDTPVNVKYRGARARNYTRRTAQPAPTMQAVDTETADTEEGAESGEQYEGAPEYESA